MSRNRIIYNSQSLYVSQVSATGTQTGVNSIKQLSRVQSFEVNFTRNFVDITQLGMLGATDRIETESPNITASFSYYLTNGENEKNIGLNVHQSGTNKEDFKSCISGLLTKVTDEKNYYLSIVEDGEDAVNYEGTKSGIIGIGNGVLTSYSINASIGQIPTADITIEGLNVSVYSDIIENQVVPAIDTINGTNLTNTLFCLPTSESLTGVMIPTALQPGDILFTIPSSGIFGLSEVDLKIQDFTMSFDLERTPFKKLGHRFPFTREINFPVTAILEINAQVGDLDNDNLSNLICSETPKEFSIIMKKPGCETNQDLALAYIFRGAKLISQNFSSTIGDNTNMNVTYEVPLGSAKNISEGVFISGSLQEISDPYDNVLFDTASFIGIVPEPYLTALNSGAARWSKYIQFDPDIVEAMRANLGDSENPVYGAPHGGTYPGLTEDLSNWNGARINSFNTVNISNGYLAACSVEEYIDILNPDYSNPNPNVKFNTYSFNLTVNLYYAEPYYIGQTLRPALTPTDWANILTHELGHALGIGVYWQSNYFGAVPPANFFLSTGAYRAAGTAYNSMIQLSDGRPNYLGQFVVPQPPPENKIYRYDNIKRPKIPVEAGGGAGTQGSHWEDDYRSSGAAGSNGITYPSFREEIMIGTYNSPNLRITDLSIKVLVDFGYVEKNPGTNEGLVAIDNNVFGDTP